MTYRMWRLSEASPENLGLVCTDDGLLLGRTPLIKRRDGRFVVRERRDIERLLHCAYERADSLERLMAGLANVARALNGDDPCLARISAVHLKIPDLPDAAARERMEVEDQRINGAGAKLERCAQGLGKASPDDPKHPSWPAGTPCGRGGKFRPKDGSDAEISLDVKIRIIRLAARRALRLASREILHLGAAAVANLVPGLDVVADAAAALDIANTISNYWKLATDAQAAFDFASKGPYSLEELQMLSNGYEEFASYGDFIKDESMLDVISKMFGRAGDGYQYHHIVTQGGANEDNISPEQLQNTDNIIRLPTLLHEAVNAEYLKPAPDDPNVTFYAWLQQQPYEVQYEAGLKILRTLHILD